MLAIINCCYLPFPQECSEGLMTEFWKEILTLTIWRVIRCRFLSITKVVVNRNGWAVVSPALPCSVLHWEFLQEPKYRLRRVETLLYWEVEDLMPTGGIIQTTVQMTVILCHPYS